MSPDPRIRAAAGYLLAEALVRLWPGTVLGSQGLTPDGFWRDALLPDDADRVHLEPLQEVLRQVAAEGPAPVVEVHAARARQLLAGQALQLELLAARDDGQPVRVRHRGAFTVLDDSTTGGDDIATQPDARPAPRGLALTTVSGAYWQGSADNPMLSRIGGLAFASGSELEARRRLLDEAKERDHRRLGRRLGIFATSDDIGAGLPLWLPGGTVVRRQLESWIAEEERIAGYQHLVTPQLAKRGLYERSGHWEHYHEDMFPPMRVADEELVLRPMNCPHHITVFKHGAHSYRDLPVRLAELGTMYRYERSGVVGGLSRVRAMTLNDAHIFCTEDQVAEEFVRALRLVERCYGTLGITDHRYRLSLRDSLGVSGKYVADNLMWERAEKVIRGALDTVGLDYEEAPGEAAFYGPKLDIQLPDLLGREETLSTIQIDFHLPEQFGLEYVAADGARHRPVIIHRGILSTMERMTAHLVELYNGAFPVWLAPVQVAVVAISAEQEPDAARWVDELVRAGLRAELVRTEGTLGSRIRAIQEDKVPFTAVIGREEAASGTVSVRARGTRKAVVLARDAFADRLGTLAATRSRELGLAPTAA